MIDHVFGGGSDLVTLRQVGFGADVLLVMRPHEGGSVQARTFTLTMNEAAALRDALQRALVWYHGRDRTP